MDEASKRIEVIIPEFWVDAKGQPQYVVVNGQEMAELESGKVQSLPMNPQHHVFITRP